MLSFAFADIEAQYVKDKQLKREDVAKLEEWQRMQPHLPLPLHPIETVLFLQSCYYSNEAAKKCIDCYYTCRSYCPELLTNLDPLSPDLQLGMDTCYMITLPDLTPEGYMVFYAGLIDPNPDKFNLNTAVKIAEMAFALALKQRGCEMGHIVILDNALPFRLKSIHYVNGVPFMDKLLLLVKPFLKKEIHDALHIHFGDNSTIFKYVPRDILPIECGGSQFCAIDYFNKVTRKHIEANSEYFKQEDNRLTDESKRPRKYSNTIDLFGVEGTFKNLVID